MDHMRVVTVILHIVTVIFLCGYYICITRIIVPGPVFLFRKGYIIL